MSSSSSSLCACASQTAMTQVTFCLVFGSIYQGAILVHGFEPRLKSATRCTPRQIRSSRRASVAMSTLKKIYRLHPPPARSLASPVVLLGSHPDSWSSSWIHFPRWIHRKVGCTQKTRAWTKCQAQRRRLLELAKACDACVETWSPMVLSKPSEWSRQLFRFEPRTHQTQDDRFESKPKRVCLGFPLQTGLRPH